MNGGYTTDNPYSYYQSMQDRLKELEKTEEERRDKLKENKEGHKRLPLGIEVKSSKLKESEKKSVELNIISKALSEAQHSCKPDIKYTPSVELNDLLDRFSKLASQSEVVALFMKINKDIGEINSASRKEFAQRIAQIQKAVEKSSFLGRQSLVITENGHSCGVKNIKVALQEFERLRKKEFDEARDNNRLEVPNEEKIVLNDYHELKELAQSNYLENTGKNNSFKKNINNIIKALQDRDKANETIKLCNKLKEELQKETSKGTVKYDDALQEVEQLIRSNNELLRKANAVLASYDMNNYMEQAKASRQQRDKDDRKESVEATYARISKEIYRIQNTEPVDYQKLEELREQLNQIRIKSTDVDIKYDQYQEIQDNAVHEVVQQEALDRMVEKEKTKEQKLIDEVNKYYAESLRKRAEEELKNSGAFDPIYQEAGLDVRDVNSNNSNRNKAIMEKMRELAKEDQTKEMLANVEDLRNEVSKLRVLASDDIYGEKTPEAIESRMHDLIVLASMPTAIERGLYDWKKQGRLPEDATANDLNPTERNDINIGYGDSVFSEIREVVENISKLSQGLDQKQIEEAYRRGGDFQYR